MVRKEQCPHFAHRKRSHHHSLCAAILDPTSSRHHHGHHPNPLYFLRCSLAKVHQNPILRMHRVRKHDDNRPVAGSLHRQSFLDKRRLLDPLKSRLHNSRTAAGVSLLLRHHLRNHHKKRNNQQATAIHVPPLHKMLKIRRTGRQ